MLALFLGDGLSVLNHELRFSKKEQKHLCQVSTKGASWDGLQVKRHQQRVQITKKKVETKLKVSLGKEANNGLE